ncbi:MAG: hypothetical protein IKU52_03685 [Clostridia bacterium]|nr:hypothetical protein [Clostridia bacterium]
MTNAQLYTIIALCVYAIAMALIGCFSYGKSKTLDGFLIGGRNIGAWVTAFAYGTTYFSAVVFVGYAGNFGWNIGVGSIWIGIGNAVLGCLISWLLFANRTRKMTKKISAKTMPDYFEKRYNSKGMKIFAAVIIFVFLVPYSAAVYKGLGSTSRLILGNTLPEGGVDSVIPTVLMKVLGSGTAGVILLAIIMILLLSASMSTLAAVVLTSASAVAVDLIPSVRKK